MSSGQRAEQRPRSPLPAPYSSPWRQLGESLQAVLAHQLLGLRRLLRLNRQGQLPRPGRWPHSLAPLFWPLLLGLVLGLAGVGVLWLRQRPRALAEPAPGVLLEAESIPSPFAQPSPAPPPPGLRADSPPSPRAAISAEPVLPTMAPPEPPSVPPQPAPAADDPLQALVAQPEASGLLAAAAVEPGRVLLRLTVLADYAELPAPERQLQADRWLAWARELGYERLELRDRAGQLVARDAQVGDGMILLSSRPWF